MIFLLKYVTCHIEHFVSWILRIVAKKKSKTYIYIYKRARISQLPLNFKITIKFHSPMASVFNGSKMAHRICASWGS